MRRMIFLLLVAGAASAVGADSFVNLNDGPLSLSLIGETGFLKVINHTITIGDPVDGNTPFDYVREGGQEILFPFNRLTAELGIGSRHRVIFLYQPLTIVTQVWLQDARTIDGETFQADDGLNVTYSFPFYRTSYLFDFSVAENTELAIGASLQLRNASVRFESTRGQTIVVTQDLGLVPILKARVEYGFRDSVIPGAYLAAEVDGFYASSAFFNGADFDFTGSIFDVSLRAGFQPTPGFETFLNVRLLGGGATGTRPAEDNIFWTQSRDGYTDNSLTSLSVTIGARLR
jgi:hypothetical protein